MRTRRLRPAPIARSVFAGFRFPSEVIVLAVRWYLRFGLSYRDIEELLAERGVEVDHVTVYRWVLRFTPLLADAAKPCRHIVGDRWLVDETYVKVAGKWRYVYRAIDQFGQVIDVFVARQRDAKAARRFFDRAIGTTKVTPVEGVCCVVSSRGVVEASATLRFQMARASSSNATASRRATGSSTASS
jgi:IS6 family transposase